MRRELQRGKDLLRFGLLKSVGEAMGMVTPVVIAKFFAPDLFGSYSLAKMVVFFFTTVLIASLQNPFVVLANQERGRTGRINQAFSAQCVLYLAACGLAAAMLAAFGPYVAAFTQTQRGDAAFLLLAFLGLAAKTGLANLFLATDEKLKSALVDVLFGSACLAGVVALHLLGRLNLRMVFATYAASAALAAVAFLRAVDLRLLLPLSLPPGGLREMLHLVKWMVLGMAAVYFINWGDNVILRAYVPMGEIGVYNLGYQFFKGAIALTAVLGTYFVPFVSRHIDDAAKVREFLNRKRPILVAMGAGALAAMFLLTPPLFRLLGLRGYDRSITVFQLLLAAALLRGYSVFHIVLYAAAKEYRALQLQEVAQVVVNLGLDLLLVPRMGIMGAVAATVTAYALRTAVMQVDFSWRLARRLGL